ncbi:hypothetical protein [Kordia sp.]|uniref:hypothetical protein n=1 Tax=Kordia sp. TaxID=1965332 RepID=UPI003D6AB01F
MVIDKEVGEVFLNGEVIGSIGISNMNDPRSIITIENIDDLSNLGRSNFEELQFDYIEVPLKKYNFYNFDWLGEYLSISFVEDESPEICLSINLEKWDMSFSYGDFINRLIFKLTKEYSFEVLKFDDKSVIFFLYLTQKEKELRDIKAYYYANLKIFKLAFDIIILELSPNQNTNQQNLSNTFTFPPEIQSSCEQYLIYFATFLKDIGINAETNIESKAHKTLFTVIPANGEEALDKIKEALQIYLSLPESPEFETVAAEFTDVGVQQLVLQVTNFKSQLMYAKATIQLKDEIIQSKQISIENLQLTNYQQKEIIQSHQPKEKNEEKLVGDLVKVNEVKVIGLTFDLPELLRRIKRKFKI